MCTHFLTLYKIVARINLMIQVSDTRLFHIHIFQIPVYKGCEVSMLGKGSSLSGYHGDDGLGDVPDQYAPSEDLLTNEHAANALVRLVNKYPGKLMWNLHRLS